MYVLAEMKDVVHVKPWLFEQDLRVVIEDELNKKFANRVIYQLGLCIALFDILKIEKSFIFPGDGSSHTRVTFRYVIFRPFIDEILTGKVKSCSKDGVYVTMAFFDDIFIPVKNLQSPSKFDEKEQLFFWQYDAAQLYLDIGEEIRFRVTDETFVDTTPTGPPKKQSAADAYQQNSNNETKSPYTIIGSIDEPGLGLLTWWTGS